MKKYLYKKRTFLNDDPNLTAFIVAIVPKFNVSERNVRAYPSLDIADCSDKVSLDFSFYTEQNMKKSMKKVRLFRDVVNGFADAMEAEEKRYYALTPEERKKLKDEDYD